MSTNRNALREQGAREDSLHAHSKPLAIQSQPLRGITAYEQMRREWIAANPLHNEAELITACIMLARRCGLILREKVLQAHLKALGGE